MEYVFFAMMVAAWAMLASRALRNLAMRITPGEHVVSDAEDSGSGLVKNALGPIMGGSLLFVWGGLFAAGAFFGEKGPAQLVFVLVSGFIALLGVYMAGHAVVTAARRLREGKLARPAVLTVSELPLAPGRRVQFKLERKLLGGFDPVTIKVKLNLLALATGHKRSDWVLHGTLDFPEVPPQFASGALYMDWDLEIPAGLMPHPHYLWGFVPDHKAYRWEFRVTATDQEGKELDSCFRLPFIFPADRRPPAAREQAS